MLQMLQDFLAFFPFYFFPWVLMLKVNILFIFSSTTGRLFWEPWRKAVYSQNHQSTGSRSIPCNGSHQSVQGTQRKTLSTLHWASADWKKGSSLLQEHSDQGFPTKKLPKKSTSKCEAIWEGGHTDDHFFWKQ